MTWEAKITDRGEFAYHQKQEFGKAVRTAVPCVGAWVVMHCIFLPNELYISNPGEFTFCPSATSSELRIVSSSDRLLPLRSVVTIRYPSVTVWISMI